MAKPSKAEIEAIVARVREDNEKLLEVAKKAQRELDERNERRKQADR